MMTPTEREAFYDSEIAPRLLELARLCQDNEISLVCAANWGTDDQDRTVTLQPHAPMSIKMTEVAAQANGNADSLIMALMKHGREHGHNSMCLHLLGVKTEAEGNPT
jgi:hypothetical protein